MAKIKTDSELDKNIEMCKKKLQSFERQIVVFLNTYRNLNPKDKADKIQNINKEFISLQATITKIKSSPSFNSAQRFSVEKIQQSFFSLQGRWKKFERASE